MSALEVRLAASTKVDWTRWVALRSSFAGDPERHAPGPDPAHRARLNQRPPTGVHRGSRGGHAATAGSRVDCRGVGAGAVALSGDLPERREKQSGVVG